MASCCCIACEEDEEDEAAALDDAAAAVANGDVAARVSVTSPMAASCDIGASVCVRVECERRVRRALKWNCGSFDCEFRRRQSKPN